MSSDRSLHYQHYLSQHFAHVNDQVRFRGRKLAYYRHNYLRLLPADLDTRILEIGPGYGELMELLAASGYRSLHAVDLSPEVAERCNQIVAGSTAVVEDTTAYLRGQHAAFDCVTMFQVLEHVPKAEVLPLLSAIRQALRPGGRLLIEVPNMANPVIGLNVRYADFTHEVGFTELSLRYVLAMAGFATPRIFEPQLTPDHWIRPLQHAVQALFRGAVHLTYRAYGHATPHVLGRAVAAVADC
jgi:2-polyprenyl-3-methyl-5-hydroxy-6-metoxy-1,4-benzoquinol methylase